MSDGKVSLLGSVARFFMFWKWGQALKINRAADARFTKDEQGVGDAFDLAYAADKTKYDAFIKALSGVESAVAIKRNGLKTLEAAQKTVLQQREGALRLYEKAELEHNQAEMDDALAAANRYQADIDTKQAAIDGLKGQIHGHEDQLRDLEEQGRQMQAKLANAPADKAMAQADFVSAQMYKEANDRLAGIRASVNEASPIDAVKKKIDEMKAEAAVSGRIANADVRHVDDKYLKAGATGVANDTIASMLAARKADKAGTGTSATPAAVTPAGSDDTPRRIG